MYNFGPILQINYYYFKNILRNIDRLATEEIPEDIKEKRRSVVQVECFPEKKCIFSPYISDYMRQKNCILEKIRQEIQRKI